MITAGINQRDLYYFTKLVIAGWQLTGTDTWRHPQGKSTQKTVTSQDRYGFYEAQQESLDWTTEQALEEAGIQ